MRWCKHLCLLCALALAALSLGGCGVRAAIGQRPDWGATRDYEGVRATVRLPGGGEGLILVRLSVHDPVLPINFESDAPGGVKILAQQLLEQIQGAQGVDLAPLAALAAP